MRFSTAIAALLAATLLVGCKSKLTGNEGNFEFSYPADDDVLDFNKPIAVGAKLEVAVAEVGTHRAVELTSATTDKETVLKVVSFSGSKLILEGIGTGSALVSVAGKKSDGTEAKDEVTMLARVPEVLKVSHTCTTESEAYYLVAQDILLPFELEMKNGQPVIGYGYFPVAFAPADGVTIDQTTTDQVFFHLKTAATKQVVVLSSKIDSTTAKLDLTDAGSIDGAKINVSPPSLTTSPGPTVVGLTNLYHVAPSVGGKLVCQARTTVTAATKTPAICDVAAASPPVKPPANGTNEWGWVSITGKAVGKCDFTVTHPEAKGGAGLTTDFSVEIWNVQKPDGSTGDSDAAALDSGVDSANG